MLLLLLSCKSDPAAVTTPVDSGLFCPGEVVETQTVVGETFSGSATLQLEVADGARAFLATFEVEEGSHVWIYSVTSPSGEEVYSYDSVYAAPPYELPSGLAQPVDGEVQVGWPMQADDPAPEAGEWLVTAYVLNASFSPVNFASIVGTVYETRSEAEEGLCLSARVILSEGIVDDTELMVAIEDAVERWRVLYAGLGIALTVEMEDSALSSTIALPADGDDDYAELDAQAEPEVITVIIGESFSGEASGVLGQTGGLPGPLLSTHQAVVGISWLMSAGIDGAFSEDEVQLLSETIAHEVGHYLGLMHPVQFDDTYDVVAFDAVDDTALCGDYDDCDADLGDNLMYPFAGCWWGGECDPQDEVTADQATVMSRYGGVR